MMKKSLLVLTAALSFGFAAAQDTAPAAPAQAPTLTDVPAGHWAKDAIDRLVERGIILGYPDGTFRGTQNLTRYEAAVIIARVLDQIRTGEVTTTTTTDGSGLTPEDVTALQNAIQELAADLTALGVRVSDLEENAVNRDDFTRLEARVEELAGATGDETAITGIQTQIDELTARADEYDTLRADVDDNASSIAALNDLTVLLNQDILNLQDRVSAAEAAQADFVTRTDFDNLSGRVTAVDNRVTGVAGRVTTLENAPKFSVGGTVSATYGRLAVINGGVNFDVDRLVNGTGISLGDADVTTATDTDDTVARTNGAYTTASVIFGVKASNLTTANGTIVVNNAAINFGVNNAANIAGGDVLVKLNDASANGTISGQKFDVTYKANYSNFKFNDYLFSSSGDGDFKRRGIVANIEATQLPFAPKITVVTGTSAGVAPRLSGNYYGIRAAVNPVGLGTVALSFAQNDANRSAFSVDYDVKAGPVSLVGAWVNSFPSVPANFVAGGGTFQNAWNSRDQAFYTDAKAGFGGVSVAANYRAIDPQFADGVAGMSGTTDLAPYGANQVGFGGAAAANIGIIAVSAYGDSRTPYAGNTPRINNFGVAAGVKFGALSAKGFYNNSTSAGKSVGVDTADNSKFDGVNTTYMGTAAVPYQFSSTVGGVLTHDGSAATALIPNLSFTVADAYFYNLRRNNATTPATNDTSAATANDLQVYGSYTATLGGVKIAPFARYHLFSTAGGALVFDEANVGTPVAAVPPSTVTPPNTYAGVGTGTYNNIKYGVQISTQPFTGVPLQPSIFANFSNRIGNPGTSVATRGTASSTELLGQAGLTFNQFLAPNLKATVGYSYYQGFKVSSAVAGLGADAYSTTIDRVYGGAGATNPLAGANFGTANVKAQGVFGQLDWNGLAANYGVFRNTDLNTNTTSVAQGFKVSYKFTF
ncbi:S-layer homology domain-containing protein [Deinococcus oregonensis]|uniref:S-layer homology domain-containing protein n=1 Tax=Deinococcus oregonensis TaxID=1805970 RepID=A0ABV6B5S3_9DEIO